MKLNSSSSKIGVLLLLCVSIAAGPATQPATKPASQPLSKISEADQIEFLQKNVQAQMQELQDRMFRLAETTTATEPGDSAKLILALRRSREELILEEMKEVLDLLGQKNLTRATTNTQDVILLNLEEKVRPDLLDVPLPATKPR